MKNKYLIDTNIIIYYFNGLTNDKFIHTVLEKSFNIVTNNISDFEKLNLNIKSVTLF